MQFEMTFSPSFQDVDLLTKRIHEDAVEKGVTAIAQPFAIYLKTDNGELIAGCNGSIVYGSIYTDQL